MSADPVPDLNSTIAAAVTARVEAEVLKALSGDETVGRFVTAALSEQVEVSPGSYRSSAKEPYVHNVLRKAIKMATHEAAKKVILEEMPSIEDEVRKALRREARVIAAQLAGSLTDAAKNSYGITVDLKIRGQG